MVKFYPRVFSPYIQDKHNQTVIGKQLFNSRRSSRLINNRKFGYPLKQWEVQLLEALMPPQSPDPATIATIMDYAKYSGTR